MQNAHLGKNIRLEIGSSSFELFFSQTFFVTNSANVSLPKWLCSLIENETRWEIS